MKVEWDSSQFSPLPVSAPLELGLQLTKGTLNNKEVLRMEFLIQNPTNDSVFVSTRASGDPLFDFTITTFDSICIWNRLQSNVSGAAKAKITLKPGETHRYEHKWNYAP